PSTAANAVHVLRMCEALAYRGHRITLNAEGSRGAPVLTESRLFALYGINSHFDIVRRPAGGALLRRLNSLRAGLSARGHDLAYARDLLAAWVAALSGVPVILELHTPLSRKWGTSRIFSHLISQPNLVRVAVITEALRRHLLE